MAGMDLKLRRNDRGTSVFWMILISGIVVLLLIAVVLATAGRGHIEATDEANAPLVTAGDSDPNPGTASFGSGETADEGPTAQGELAQDGPIDPDIEPAAVEGESAPDAADAAPEEEAAPALDIETDGQDDVTIDESVERDPPRFQDEPDPNQPATELTPSGPEGRDDETILDDEINVGGEDVVGPEIEIDGLDEAVTE